MGDVRQKEPRDTAPQTEPQKPFKEPRPRRKDSLNDPPGERHRKLRCNKCKAIVNQLSQEVRRLLPPRSP